MKVVLFLISLSLLVSCGKDSSVSSKDSTGCNLNGRSVACENIQGADGQGIDLLESMVDASIEVTDSSITFLSERTSLVEGRRISCSTAVEQGETYSYSVNGDTLTITARDKKLEFKRLNASEGLIGAWAWRGYEGEGAYIIRQMTFLSKNRAILRTVCEL